MVSAMSEKDIQDAFCVIDVDGDGTITLDELRYILTNMSTIDSFSGKLLILNTYSTCNFMITVINMVLKFLVRTALITFCRG